MTKAQALRFVQLMNETARLAEEFTRGSPEYDELALALACVMRARRIVLSRVGDAEDAIALEPES